MALNKTLLVYILVDIAFLAVGIAFVYIPLLTERVSKITPTISTVEFNLVSLTMPLGLTTANGAIMILAFVLSLPGIFLRKRILLVGFTWIVLVTSIITLSSGIFMWTRTLKTKTFLQPIWYSQNINVTSLLQIKFNCCGFNDTTKFVTNPTCPNSTVAATKGLCIGPVTSLANQFEDLVFTGFFGVVGLDGILILMALCLLKERAEKERYRLIDDKKGGRLG